MIEPPDWISARAKRLWNRVMPELVGRGIFENMFSLSLEILVGAVDRYLSTFEDIRNLAAKGEPIPPELAQRCQDRRMFCRDQAARFFLIDEARTKIGAVDPDGFDSEIRRIFKLNEDDFKGGV